MGGLPQRRRRCIAGNFDFDLLQKYAASAPRLSLGAIVKALGAKEVVDPIYGIRLQDHELRDHVPEAALSDEEVRINRSNKLLHPVYNSMPFPDPLRRSVRTICARSRQVLWK